MARTFSEETKNILIALNKNQCLSLHDIYTSHNYGKSKKEVYNILYRLIDQELVAIEDEKYFLTDYGVKLIHKLFPKKDGIWKIIIFDIPEKNRKVRTVLRSKLESLGFRKWQNSIWISPFALDPDIELELNQLSERYFIRLIKTQSINRTDDIENMFS
jgi:DNA-binding transcriptional regulator PaaX